MGFIGHPCMHERGQIECGVPIEGEFVVDQLVDVLSLGSLVSDVEPTEVLEAMAMM